MAKEELVDAFESEEIVAEESVETGKEKKVKPVEKLEADKLREDKDGNSVIKQYEEYIELLGGWSGMSEADKKKINATFKRPGRFGGERTDVSKLSPAHRQALNLNKIIRDAAYAGVENNAMDSFNELQALSPDAKVSVEVYFKGWKIFINGLPEEEKK